MCLGKGLTLTASVIEGGIQDRYAEAQAAQQTLTTQLKKEKAKGFAEVLVANSIVEGLSHM